MAFAAGDVANRTTKLQRKLCKLRADVRTYPNPWRAFLFCLPFIPFFIALSIAFQNKDVWIMKLIRVHIDERSTNKKECFV